MDQGKPDLDCMMYYLLFLVENMYSTKIVFLFFQSEVEYAKFLIEEFDSGLTKDLKTGHTKRSFLSEKLLCAPMRVSKKFPGPSIGKATFSRASIGEDGNPLPKKVFEGYEIRHNALRIKFLRKILSSELKVSQSYSPNRCLTMRLLFLTHFCIHSVDSLGYESPIHRRFITFIRHRDCS